MYESCKTPIRIAFFGFVLLSIGFLIQNPNVNLFYTFKSSVILFLGELFLNVGQLIIMNLPLIFMFSIVCKKANNGTPLLMVLVAYFTYLVTTMLFARQDLGSSAYSTGYGVNSIFGLLSGTRLPLETGLIGSMLVGYATRIAYLRSRHPSSFSLLSFLDKDTAGLIYSMLFAFVLGTGISYVYPFAYSYIQKAITYIGQDLMDPIRLALYGVLDRFLCLLGLSNVIRTPFWFGSLGGSYSNALTGQTVLGDVNIWAYVVDAIATYAGAGRFITPYYVINMFIIPGFYLATVLSMSDKKERHKTFLSFIAAIGFSVVAGNPLPVELFMVFTSPGLYVVYLALVGTCFGAFIKLDTFLGFEYAGSNTAIAMPGSFPDFIINLRNAAISKNLGMVATVGLASFAIMFIITIIYYRLFAFDAIKTGKGDKLIDDLLAAVGGPENINEVGSGLLKLNISLFDLELVSVQALQKLEAAKILETKNGLCIEFGTASRMIGKRLLAYKRKILTKQA